MKGNQPAFPVPSPCYDHVEMGELFGMTLRDYFAAAALQGWAAGRNAEWAKSGGSHPDVIAKSCYAYADAMLAAREVPNG